MRDFLLKLGSGWILLPPLLPHNLHAHATHVSPTRRAVVSRRHCPCFTAVWCFPPTHGSQCEQVCFRPTCWTFVFSPFFLDVVCTSLHVRWWTCSGVCCVLVCVSFVFKCLYLHVCSFRGALVGTLGSYQVLFAPFSWEPMRFYLVAVKMNRQSQ